MRAYRYLGALAVVLGLGACETLTVPDLNNPGLESLTENPTRSAVIAAAQGLLLDARNGIAGRAGYVSALGILGRESYNFDPSDPRFVTEMLIGPLDGGSPAFGGNHWDVRYRGFRDANLVLGALDAVGAQMSDAEKASIRGFARTLAALDLLLVINTRDENGAVISVGEDPTGEPEPIVSKAETFAEIERLLDDAVTDLQAGGGVPDFFLPSGFAIASTTAGFIRFNRALRARVAVYQGDFQEALTTYLPASFLDPAGSLATGVYYNYGTGSGETANALFDLSNVLLVHPSVETDAQLRPGGEPDLRFVTKTRRLATPVNDQATQGISSDLVFNLYNNASAPVPIIRNEELILLRAEANLALGNLDAALADVNLIRQTSGGLAPIGQLEWTTTFTADDRLNELLYNKRYSLLYEGGHRWIDMRRYDKLDELPLDRPNFFVAERFPFPVDECDARSPRPSQGC